MKRGKNSQGRDPRTHESETARDGTPGPMKERAVPAAGKVVTVRHMEKDASENPRCVRESDVSCQREEACIERLCW